MNKFSEMIDALITRKNLSQGEAREVMREILDGRVPSAQIAAFLATLRAKGETVDEIVGFVHAMRESMTRVNAGTDIVVDTCGTGGDSKGTFNISTASAFVVAGAGFAVAKHGNRSVSSSCGSADVLEALGVKIDLLPDAAEKVLREVGIVFLFAPLYHPAMKNVGPVRKELGIRTIFNLLGPLVNPASANVQVIGVPRKDLVPLLAKVLQKLSAGRRSSAIVVHEDGHDEIILSGKGVSMEITDSKAKPFKVVPGVLGLKKIKAEALRGGNADENARILREVFAGKNPDLTEIVAANAALAIYAAERINNPKTSKLEAALKAKESLRSGQALKKLELLIERSRA